MFLAFMLLYSRVNSLTFTQCNTERASVKANMKLTYN